MARRRRIRFDPPARRKGKWRGLPLASDQLFMSRRLLLARGALVTGFAVLAGRLGFMQVVKRDTYRAQARSNTRHYQTTPAPRGLIFDRAGRVLAENKTAWQVRVVPAKLPRRDSPERRRILDSLITELDLPEALVIDWRACPSETREAVYAQVAMLRGRVGDEVQRSVEAIKERTKIDYLVLLEDRLSVEQAARFREAARGLSGLRVMNILDYQIGNAPESTNPIIVRTDVPREIALRLAANQLYLPGVEIDGSVLVRHYPGGPVMSHLLGYVGRISAEELESRTNPVGTRLYEPNDFIGKAGLESTMEDLLRGEKGGRWILSDVTGVQLGTVPGTTETKSKPGQDLRLTIDLELQAAVSRALAQGIRFANEDRRAIDNIQEGEIFAKSGAVVALNPNNGEVLAMVSYPHYDNQLFVDGISEAKWQEYTDEEQGQPYVNRAIASSQPPGSTLKVFHAISALHENKITPETTHTCTGAIRVPLDWNEAQGNMWPCWQKFPGHRELDLYGAIKQSCDVYFYNVGAPRDKPQGSSQYLRYYDYNREAETNGQLHYFDGLGIKLIHKNLTEQFWFGSQTKFDLDGEAPGVAPNEAWLKQNYGQGWSVGETINTSIGQGFFEATPLQLAVNTVALANSGTLYRPTLIREIVGSDETVAAASSTVLRRMTVDKAHFAAVREAMRQVVHDEDGSANHWMNTLTGRNETRWPLTNPPDEEDVIEIGGKTGTAEVGSPDPETNVYPNQHAWFTCFAPFDDPEIVVTALVEYGGEGSNYAVPVVDQTLRAYFELTGRRKRGLVLREDKVPESDPATKAELMPTPGSTVNPNRD
jgi:penicillin-binding protein 2